MQVISDLQCGPNNPSSIVNIKGLTTLQYFPTLPGPAIGVISPKNGYLYVPGNNEMLNQRMTVRAGGVWSSIGAGSAATIGLYPVSFTNNNTAVATPLSTPIASLTANLGIAFISWYLTADLVGDHANSVTLLSGNIVVNSVGTIASSVLSPAQVTALGTGTVVNMNAPIPFGLVMGITFATSDALSTANMYQFDLSA